MRERIKQARELTRAGINIVIFCGHFVRYMAKDAWEERRKWRPDYVPHPRAWKNGAAVPYDELHFWQKFLGRL